MNGCATNRKQSLLRNTIRDYVATKKRLRHEWLRKIRKQSLLRNTIRDYVVTKKAAP